MIASISSQLEPALSSPSLLTSSSVKERSVSYFESVIGAAVFDLSGLPKEYFTAGESHDISWVQTIFQALGLQSLLTSSLRLEGFHHVVVHGTRYRAIVVRQKTYYVAILIEKTNEAISESLIKWAQEFNPRDLKSDPRFSAV